MSGPVSSAAPWPQHQLLPPGSSIVFLPDFPHWSVIRELGAEISPSLPGSLLVRVFSTAIKTLAEAAGKVIGACAPICLQAGALIGQKWGSGEGWTMASNGNPALSLSSRSAIARSDPRMASWE